MFNIAPFQAKHSLWSRKRRLLPLLALVSCLALFCPACVPKGEAGSAQAAAASTQSVPKAKHNMFTPLEKEGVFKLSEKEALALAKRLSPAAQGLSSWRDMDFAIQQSLAFASAKPAGGTACARPGFKATWGELCASLRLMSSLLPQLDANPALLAKNFTWYRLGPDTGFTGYYEPTLNASRGKTQRFYYPLYRVPPDLRKGKSYHSRNSIDRKNALQGRGLEIAWVDSEVDAFFLHVQGSGRLLFPDGSTTHVLYAGKNNHSYASIGRLMREQGLLPKDNVSMASIKAWLAANPSRQAELLDQNASYVFFREASRGPVGGMGKPLTPWVSMAVHPKRIPYGTLMFVSIPLPATDPSRVEPFNGLALAQDAGGAIKGNRMDLFCGPGEKAAHVAGYLDAPGAAYILLPAKK